MTLRSVRSPISRACEGLRSGSQIRSSTSWARARTRMSRSLPWPKKVRGSGPGRRWVARSTRWMPAVRHSSRSSCSRAVSSGPSPWWIMRAMARVPCDSARAPAVAATRPVSRSRMKARKSAGMSGGRRTEKWGSSSSSRASTPSGTRGKPRTTKMSFEPGCGGAREARSIETPAGPRWMTARRSRRSLARSASSSTVGGSTTRWVRTRRTPRRRPPWPRTRVNSGRAREWASPRMTRWTRPRRSMKRPSWRPSCDERSSRSRARTAEMTLVGGT